MYKVSEVAKILGVSTPAVYKKMKKLQAELKGHIKTHNGVKHLTEDGLSILSNKPIGNQKFETTTNQPLTSDEAERLKALLKGKEELVTQLQDWNKKQEEHIQQHIKEKENLTELLRNSQVLMKQEQDRVLMLEHKLQEQSEVDESVEIEKELAQGEVKKSFWTRIFSS